MRFKLVLFPLLLCTQILTFCENKYVFIIPTYNNISFFKENIKSIVNQEGNFRVIIIDACSSDGTGDAIRKWIKKNKPQCKIDIYTNTRREFALQNTYRAVHCCQDNEIIITVDGDDWLPHNNVLKRLDKEYDKGSWLTYGSHQTFPHNKYIKLPIYNRNTPPRKQEWCFSHLRTFYAGLFKKIKVKDLFYQSKFSPVVHDFAMMYPMVEMANEKTSFISDVMYIYNRANILHEGGQFPNLCFPVNKFLRNKKVYRPISSFNHKKNTFLKITDLSQLNNLTEINDEFIIFGKNTNLHEKTINMLNQTHLNIGLFGTNKNIIAKGNIIAPFNEKEKFHAVYLNLIKNNITPSFIMRKKTFKKIKSLNINNNFISSFIHYLTNENPLVLYHLK
jgi:glycosyltransferase involved in cell wall biosynthesis